MNVRIPSLDAAAHYTPLLKAAEQEQQVLAQDVAASRRTVDAMKAIAAIDFTPAVAAQIAAVLSAKVSAASWVHWKGVEMALAMLDDTVDALAEIGRAE